MNAVIEKGKYHKYIIHTLAAGALTFSFATVSHVNQFMHTFIRPGPVKSKTLTKKNEVGSTEEFGASTPPPEPGTSALSSMTMKSNIGEKTGAIATTTNATVQPIQTAPPTPKKQPLIIPQAHAQDTMTTPSSSFLSSQKQSVVTIDKTKIDVNFIRQMEGSVLKAYVPLATTTKSGVTVGDGVDLGQMNLSEFNSLPISAALKSKLQPYIGLRQLKAKAFLKAHPLVISNDEMNQLNAIVANKILKPLATMYQKSSGKSFTSLPAAAQTALFSYAYQYGPGFMFRSSAKKLWNYFVTENWSKASTMLRSSQKYTGRRKQEANLLDKIA